MNKYVQNLTDQKVFGPDVREMKLQTGSLQLMKTRSLQKHWSSLHHDSIVGLSLDISCFILTASFLMCCGWLHFLSLSPPVFCVTCVSLVDQWSGRVCCCPALSEPWLPWLLDFSFFFCSFLSLKWFPVVFIWTYSCLSSFCIPACSCYNLQEVS